MIKYLYETCTGNWYLSDEILSFEETYCETCGDSHNLLWEFETSKDMSKEIFDFLTEDEGEIYEDYIPDYSNSIKELKKLFNLDDDIIKKINEKLEKRVKKEKEKMPGNCF